MGPLDRAAALYSIGALRAEELPALACAALEHGMSSTALAVLAGESPRYAVPADLWTLFKQALDETGTSLPAPAEARAALLQFFAAAAVTGALAPQAAAWRIVEDLYYGTDARNADTEVVGRSMGIERLVAAYWDWRDNEELQAPSDEVRAAIIEDVKAELQRLGVLSVGG